ncbi:MAG: tRNA (N6-threonylcarbamoyladenosine(37)-N6)-methyltransferase TrmO [Clostridia bacterium]|nr:tRNA (N6-threonylcarbamoyladenosine(37)-N6)-methyltransferase TrmO [Clostridia bacterium]
MRIIAHIENDFGSKFAIPRQSGIAEELVSRVVFEGEFANPDYIRGIERFSHLWLIWCFSENASAKASPTVRPPRLGGNTRMGVFATRSPYRPNPIGLSCVKLLGMEEGEKGSRVLVVSGADLMDGTPIYDIKPYLPSADCKPDASGGFTDEVSFPRLAVQCDPALLEKLPPEKGSVLLRILEEDPRPAYHDDPARIYGFSYAGREVRFSVRDGVLTVVSIE